MNDAQEPEVTARVKAVLIDPGTMSVLWANDAAIGDAADDALHTDIEIEQVVPLTVQLGVRDALDTAMRTGTAQHLHANLVSTGRGALALVVSVYPLPDGKALVLVENAWQAVGRTSTEPGQGRGARRRAGR